MASGQQAVLWGPEEFGVERSETERRTLNVVLGPGIALRMSSQADPVFLAALVVLRQRPSPGPRIRVESPETALVVRPPLARRVVGKPGAPLRW